MNQSCKAKMNEVNLENALIVPKNDKRSRHSVAVCLWVTCTNGFDSLQLLTKNFLFVKQLLVSIISSPGKLLMKPKLLHVATLHSEKELPNKSCDRSQVEQGIHPIDKQQFGINFHVIMRYDAGKMLCADGVSLE